jgi:hypothetical protein
MMKLAALVFDMPVDSRKMLNSLSPPLAGLFSPGDPPLCPS